jgi:hypothetical protein
MTKESTTKPVVRTAIKQWNTARQKQLHHLHEALRLKREMEFLGKIINDGYAAS